MYNNSIRTINYKAEKLQTYLRPLYLIDTRSFFIEKTRRSFKVRCNKRISEIKSKKYFSKYVLLTTSYIIIVMFISI